MSEQTASDQLPDGAILKGLAAIGVPAAALDRRGVVRWMNDRALQLFGDRRGEAFADGVSGEFRQWTKLGLARLLVGGYRGLDWRARLFDRDGRGVGGVIHAAAIEDGASPVGVFGILQLDDASLPVEDPPHLTARQMEVLLELEQGSSTRQISDSLQISTETVRNHVRGILRAFGVHSRVEALAAARRAGLV